jgi:hypothetical protein
MFSILSFLMVYFVFDNTYVFNCNRNIQLTTPDPGSVSVSQDYGSVDPDLKELFTDSQHRAVFKTF